MKKNIIIAIAALLVGVLVAVFTSKPSEWPSDVGFEYQPRKSILVSPLQLIKGSEEASANPLTIETLDASFFQDKWTIAFIGFTFCPDICPAAMSQLAKLEKAIATNDYADNVQVLFISVDPNRDDVEKAAKYSHFFSPTFNTATGTVAQLEAMTNSMNLLFLIPEDTTDPYYQVDHSASFALISPQGLLAGNMRETNNIELMKKAIESVQ